MGSPPPSGEAFSWTPVMLMSVPFKGVPYCLGQHAGRWVSARKTEAAGHRRRAAGRPTPRAGFADGWDTGAGQRRHAAGQGVGPEGVVCARWIHRVVGRVRPVGREMVVRAARGSGVPRYKSFVSAACPVVFRGR